MIERAAAMAFAAGAMVFPGGRVDPERPLEQHGHPGDRAEGRRTGPEDQRHPAGDFHISDLYHTISRPTGQWSLPRISGQMKALRRFSRRLLEQRK